MTTNKINNELTEKDKEQIARDNSLIKRAKDQLKEEFYSKIAEFSQDGGNPVEPYAMQRIADWFLSRLISKEELLEWVEKNKVKTKLDLRPDGKFGDLTEVGAYNQALSDPKDFLNHKNK